MTSPNLTVRTYQASYSATWSETQTRISAAQLRSLAVHPHSQNSIRELSWDAFQRQCPAEATRPPTATVVAQIAEGHAWRIARVRIGQAAFRQQLIDRYGTACAMTGPCPAGALEAAHLYSYASSGRHQNGGGFLLRRDLHRLFDSGEIAVKADTGTIDLTRELRTFDSYSQLQGSVLLVDLSTRQRDWLTVHWRQFRSQS